MTEKVQASLAEKNQTRESLSRRSLIWTEEYSSSNGMVASVGHWGWKEKLQDSGFDELYRMPKFYKEEEIDRDVMEVASRLATNALKRRGWDPGEVDYLDVGISVAKGDMAKELAAKLGMENAQTAFAYLACNSAGYLLHRRLQGFQEEASKGKKALLVAVDPITRMLRDPEKTDDESGGIFSNGAAVLAFTDEELKLITGVATESRDRRGITAIAPYADQIGDWVGDDDHVIFQDGNGNAMMQMSTPPDGKIFYMNPTATAVVFIPAATSPIASVHQQYKEFYPDREPDHAVGHYPGDAVVRGIENRLRKKHGIKLPFKRVIYDGNSSGATSLIAFARSMFEYKPGDHVLYVSYGAGGSANCIAVEIGGGAAA